MEHVLPFDVWEILLKHIGSHKPSLAALASTCRAFHEPAIDALWRELDRVGSLMALAPVDNRMLSPKPLGSEFRSKERRRKIPCSSLHKRDWVRFDFYAKRVEVFGHPILQRFTSSSAYALLCDARPSIAPLPQLRMLQVVENQCNLSKIMLPTSLRSLEMIYTNSPPGSTCLREVAEKAPLLEHLIVSGVLPPLSRVVTIFSCLRRLDLRNVIVQGPNMSHQVDDFIRSIAFPDALTELHLPCLDPSIDDMEFYRAYSGLENLTLNELPHMAVHVLDRVAARPSMLQKLCIREVLLKSAQNAVYGPSWLQLAHMLAISHPALKSIDIQATSSMDEGMITLVVKSLTALCNIEEFRIKMRLGPMGIAMSGDIPDQIVSAWPRIRVLVLDLSPYLSLDVLPKLAVTCKELIKLKINVAYQEDIWKEMATLGDTDPIAHALQKLRIHISHPSVPYQLSPLCLQGEQLAEVVDHCFPTLVRFDLGSTLGGRYRDVLMDGVVRRRELMISRSNRTR